MNSIRIPLAERVRPSGYDEVCGQDHLLGEKGKLRQLLESGSFPSMILWGPPGVGKTTIAQIVAGNFNLPFHALSAVNAGVKDVREVIRKAETSGHSVLFIDEIHRFSKSQQDSLLAAVEKGIIKLIGATTENPSFEVISPLLSRCQVYVLRPLDKEDLLKVLEMAISRDEFFSKKDIKLENTDLLLLYSGGDARKLLNLLELIVEGEGTDVVTIDSDLVNKYHSTFTSQYDKTGEQHYDIISAFIKSLRGSDPNAALYWLVRMMNAGEDPKFIARRMIILASEDIGMANPTALVMANNCFQAVDVIGYPECELILSHVAVYLATSPKSNSTYKALQKTKDSVDRSGDLSVPLYLRNAPTAFMKELQYGHGYKYPHDFPANFTVQEYLPEEISGSVYYEPGNNVREDKIRDQLKKIWDKNYKY